jgi:hypothetical protein
MVTHEEAHRVRMGIADPPRSQVDLHHAVNHRSGIGIRVFHHIADRVRGLVEERLDLRFHIHVHRIVAYEMALRPACFA